MADRKTHLENTFPKSLGPKDMIDEEIWDIVDDCADPDDDEDPDSDDPDEDDDDVSDTVEADSDGGPDDVAETVLGQEVVAAQLQACGLYEGGNGLLYLRGTDLPVAVLDFLALGDPVLRVRCSHHTNCCLLVSCRTQLHDKWAAGIQWAAGGAFCVLRVMPGNPAVGPSHHSIPPADELHRHFRESHPHPSTAPSPPFTHAHFFPLFAHILSYLPTFTSPSHHFSITRPLFGPLCYSPLPPLTRDKRSRSQHASWAGVFYPTCGKKGSILASLTSMD